MDSTGLGTLALASGRLKEVGGSLAIVAPGGRVLEMLTLTQINMIVKVCPTVDAAAAAL
jgi:anti-anti-sigma factor